MRMIMDLAAQGGWSRGGTADASLSSRYVRQSPQIILNDREDFSHREDFVAL
jgi:hypothetical protein